MFHQEIAMRNVVMGTGGVGGYFGARLATSGCDVGFVARGRQLEALRSQGLRLQSPLGDVTLSPVRASDNPADLGKADLVLFGVKLWDTVEAAQLIRPLIGDDTAVVSFQNGVMKDDILKEALGAKHVIGGVAYIAATITDPGIIRHTGTMQKLVFGEYGGAVTPRVERFRDACVTAGIDVEVPASIEQAIWEKFVFLVALSGTTTLARVPIGRIRGNERSRAFFQDVMDEVVQVARAEGVPLAPDFAARRIAFADQLPPTMTSSMHGDLDRGSRLEVEWLSGDVVRRGKRLGIPTPCNRVIYDLLSIHSAGRSA
jgi:2-dehydropantoate 2-reductase